MPSPNSPSNVPGLSSFKLLLNDGEYSYPLLIRLEIHLSPDWQRVLVRQLKTVLNGLLYDPTEDTIDWSMREPSPVDFQNKILLAVEPSFDV